MIPIRTLGLMIVLTLALFAAPNAGALVCLGHGENACIVLSTSAVADIDSGVLAKEGSLASLVAAPLQPIQSRLHKRSPMFFPPAGRSSSSKSNAPFTSTYTTEEELMLGRFRGKVEKARNEGNTGKEGKWVHRVNAVALKDSQLIKDNLEHYTKKWEKAQPGSAKIKAKANKVFWEGQAFKAGLAAMPSAPAPSQIQKSKKKHWWDLFLR